MTVHARGYRAYQGDFSSDAYAWTIFVEGLRTAIAGRGYKILAVILLLAYVIMVSILYIALHFSQAATGMGGTFDFGPRSAEILAGVLVNFYAAVAGLIGTIVVLLNGAGLVADDVRTRGMSLYLVRPLRPIQYAIGKALILPALLVPILLLPGVLVYLVVGGWQPPGTSTAWLAENSVFATSTTRYFVAAAAGDTGVMLILSSLLRRRGWVRVAGVGVFFGGSMVASIGLLMSRSGGGFLQYASVGSNAQASWYGLLDLLPESQMLDQFDLADPNIGLAVNCAVLLTGVACAWHRARSVEVSA